jgi:hypothetical protein
VVDPVFFCLCGKLFLGPKMAYFIFFSLDDYEFGMDTRSRSRRDSIIYPQFKALT